MSQSTTPTVRFSDLAVGSEAICFAQLVERVRNTTRSGPPLFLCRFRDSRQSYTTAIGIGADIYAAASEWQVGQCFKLQASLIKTEKYGVQLAIRKIRPVNDGDREHGFDPLDLVERSRFDPAAMFADLRQLAEENIADIPLRTLVLSIFDKYGPALQLLPGSFKHYYPFAGGWVEHTLSVAHTCLHLAERYRAHYSELQPPLNQDLLVAGAVLHDIGRLPEFDDPLTAQPTVAGRLHGHLVLGRDLVRDAARSVPDLDAELLLLLEHLILTHLTLPEWGSPRLPALPECLILHHADDLDAKLEMYIRCLTRDASAGPFTDRDPMLGKQLFKGRKA